jgi:hypothetical protein
VSGRGDRLQLLGDEFGLDRRQCRAHRFQGAGVIGEHGARGLVQPRGFREQGTRLPSDGRFLPAGTTA